MELKNLKYPDKIKKCIFFLGVFSIYFLWDIKTFFIDKDYYYFFDFRLFFLFLLFYSFPIKINLKQKNLLIFFLLLLANELITIFYYKIFAIKNILSILLLISFFFITLKNYNNIIHNFKLSINILTFILLLFLIYELINNNISYGNACNLVIFKNKFLFKENSHLSFFIPSIILYFSYHALEFKSKKFLILAIISYLLFFAFMSLSLLIATILSVIIVFFLKKRHEFKIKTKLFYLALLISSLCFIIFNNHCFERFENTFKLSKNNNTNKILDYKNYNESSLVYHDNIQILKKSFYKYPFGVGLNNYSYSFEKYSDTNFNPLNLNYNDGRSVFIKFVVEFGIFAFYFLVIFILFIRSDKVDLSNKILLSSMIISQLVSGYGYFNGGFLVTCFLIYFNYFNFKKINP